jgi:hypothetical protein
VEPFTPQASVKAIMKQRPLGGAHYNAHAASIPCVRAVLCAGLYPNVVRASTPEDAEGAGGMGGKGGKGGKGGGKGGRGGKGGKGGGKGGRGGTPSLEGYGS